MRLFLPPVDPFLLPLPPTAQVLRAVPGTVLWLLDGGETARTNLRRQARLAGVEEGRVVFAPLVGKEEHLRRLRLADLFVDTPVSQSSLGTGDGEMPPSVPPFLVRKHRRLEAGREWGGASEHEAVAARASVLITGKNSSGAFCFR